MYEIIDQSAAEEWESALQPFMGYFATEKQGTFVAAIRPAWELHLPRQTNVPVEGLLENPCQVPDDMNESSGTMIAINFPEGIMAKFHSTTIRHTDTGEEVANLLTFVILLAIMMS